MDPRDRLKKRTKSAEHDALSLPVVSGGDGESRKGHGNRRNDNSNKGSCRSSFVFIVALVISVLMGGLGTYYYFFRFFLAQHDTELRTKQLDGEDVQGKLKKLLSEKSALERQLQIQIDAKLEEKVTNLEKRIERLLSYKKKINANIQKWSKYQLLQKYGPGPHYVEMKVAFDPNSNVADVNGNTASIILELASEEFMPHTVYFFLEQIDHHLYDGCSFHRNAGHVIQAGTAPSYITPKNATLMKSFRETGLMAVFFQEYSEKYPHVKYTVGYAGRPGGPDMYISTQNNTKGHGPGGQANYDDPSEADPCFAKVIQGFEVVDRIHRSEVEEGAYKHMKHNVGIQSIRKVLYDPKDHTVREYRREAAASPAEEEEDENLPPPLPADEE